MNWSSFWICASRPCRSNLRHCALKGWSPARRVGKTIYYSIANEKVRAVIGVLYSAFCNVKPARAA